MASALARRAGKEPTALRGMNLLIARTPTSAQVTVLASTPLVRALLATVLSHTRASTAVCPHLALISRSLPLNPLSSVYLHASMVSARSARQSRHVFARKAGLVLTVAPRSALMTAVPMANASTALALARSRTPAKTVVSKVARTTALALAMASATTALASACACKSSVAPHAMCASAKLAAINPMVSATMASASAQKSGMALLANSVRARKGRPAACAAIMANAAMVPANAAHLGQAQVAARLHAKMPAVAMGNAPEVFASAISAGDLMTAVRAFVPKTAPIMALATMAHASANRALRVLIAPRTRTMRLPSLPNDVQTCVYRSAASSV